MFKETATKTLILCTVVNNSSKAAYASTHKITYFYKLLEKQPHSCSLKCKYFLPDTCWKVFLPLFYSKEESEITVYAT